MDSNTKLKFKIETTNIIPDDQAPYFAQIKIENIYQRLKYSLHAMASSKNWVLVIGDSNLGIICEELKRPLKILLNSKISVQFSN